MVARQAILDAATGYLRRHPDEVTRALRNVVGLRFGVPVPALQWLASQGNGRGPQDVVIEAVPPGIKVAATLDLMKTEVRATTSIYIERVNFSEDELKVELRLEGTRMEVLDEGRSHLAALIQSGALDLTKAGSLAAHLPEVQALLSESRDNRIVIDLTKHPVIGRSRVVRRAVGLVSSFVTVHGVETDPGHLDVALRAFPRGVRGAASAVRRHLLDNARPWIRGMLSAGGQNRSDRG